MGKIIVQKKDYVIIIDNVYRSGTFASGTRNRNTGTPLPAPAYAAETWQVEKVGIILLANNKTNKSPQEAEQCWVPARAATN